MARKEITFIADDAGRDKGKSSLLLSFPPGMPMNWLRIFSVPWVIPGLPESLPR
jgi:hypothetical protein